MNAIVEWMGEVGRRFRATENPEEQTAEPEPRSRETPQSSLFSCPDCAAVYIATEKATCSTCETDVAQIPATLSESA